ncbi:hypothetical protein CK623_06275 [Vandammella animalimorsus]|uniref:UPF0301 protein CK623_06275 n=1 Tax=Vandammella animalimorsus TaxID=2029117 RepID=A0A2A2ACY4_9BURK|nr:YqgE/AlgH family protein [Vandammella animalimorsus]PAT36400.1 hypothetical protein CK625_11485 [Vandammella animalimorsus]PAT40290.1 hypothetical protein CK623_06275 [Vandammella animalimorsus]
MSSPPAMDLTGHLLIAMPGLEDELFGGSVVYVCEHNDKGALGLIVNKTTDISVRHLFSRLELALARDDLADMPVLLGGPLHQDRGFVLHDAAPGAQGQDAWPYASTLPVGDGLAMTSSRDVMDALSQGDGPRKALLALGCASWDEGQLESELAANAWLTVKADRQLLFELAPQQRYARAFELLGIDPQRIVPMVGHA